MGWKKDWRPPYSVTQLETDAGFKGWIATVISIISALKAAES